MPCHVHPQHTAGCMHRGDTRDFQKHAPSSGPAHTFCRISSSSGLRSRSMEEMLSRLFLRPMPAAKGFAMMPGDICKAKGKSHLVEAQRTPFQKFHSSLPDTGQSQASQNSFNNLKLYTIESQTGLVWKGPEEHPAPSLPFRLTIVRRTQGLSKLNLN